MWYVLGESSSTSLSADRANSCTVPELLQDLYGSFERVPNLRPNLQDPLPLLVHCGEHAPGWCKRPGVNLLNSGHVVWDKCWSRYDFFIGWHVCCGSIGSRVRVRVLGGCLPSLAADGKLIGPVVVICCSVERHQAFMGCCYFQLFTTTMLINVESLASTKEVSFIVEQSDGRSLSAHATL